MRIVTYNIHFAVGRDGFANLDRITEAVDGADVIALQEVERFWPRSGMIDQPLGLGKRLPDYWWVYGPNLDLHSQAAFPGEAAGQRRQFGNMVLSRTPILASENVPLPRLADGARSMRRGALEAIIETPSGGVRVVSTHLCYLSAPTRVAQVRRIFDRQAQVAGEGGAWNGTHPPGTDWFLGDEPAMPDQAIVAGDFNFGPNRPEYAATVGNGQSPFVDAWPIVAGLRGGSTKDGERIDQVWMTPNLVPRLRDAWVDETATGSDHHPLWFDIDL